MKLETIYVRHFRSFNFDYLRQERERVEPNPWDSVPDDPDAFYPFVAVELDAKVTTIVGANESGKSQLITAIRCLLGDEAISPKDFCRYSPFFGVRGTMPLPQFGGKFASLSDAESAAVGGIAGGEPVNEFWFFRLGHVNRLWVRRSTGLMSHDLEPEQVDDLGLPTARLIRSRVALPSSVSLFDLVQERSSPHPRDRAAWTKLQKDLKLNETLLEAGTSPSIYFPPAHIRESRDEEAASESLSLVRDLLVNVADVDPQAFQQLLEASDTDDGYSAAITESMSQAIADSLNFPHWWSQDQDFALEVHKDGFFLVLTMRDRTGQRYTFDERSGGMKYFLSYFIQHRAYGPQVAGRDEIVLMDEPDAFLSTEGQQDLLRVLKAYAEPDGGQPAQVLYVTHSPFLIDRNYPERIRVLEKGYGEEGTRVVEKVAVDKYEPLRSAFGSFHADTAFIGSCNLLVEGPADLVLFSGVSAAMRVHGHLGANLDLNSITMVPVHGGTQYRYMLHLTLGRDVDRPAVVVLLDSDSEGVRARDGLEKGFADKPIIDSQLIIEIGSLPNDRLTVGVSKLEEPEDLVPPAVAREALVWFAREVLSEAAFDTFTQALPASPVRKKSERVYDQIRDAALEASAGLDRSLSFGKIEFAKAVGAIAASKSNTNLGELFANFSALFEVIVDRQALALRDQNEEHLRQLTRRLVERFRRDHRTRASKAIVDRFLREVERHLVSSSVEEEAVRSAARKIRDDFKLTVNPMEDIGDFPALKSELNELIFSPSRQGS
ncbi:AAA family ATPase [Microbacterium sp. CFBP 13617]|uniref:AAA family ATPase n=1 Tax=Microbacterium sp. CFBP 13617 TaxID=2774035 RepID=UPI001786B8B3|nr:AAA family ATPase [Microbacterium sp. CFBP 13617]MBD8219624.1 AAA family ATPase [Microbacterium sp. CFBP 13617]